MPIVENIGGGFSRRVLAHRAILYPHYGVLTSLLPQSTEAFEQARVVNVPSTFLTVLWHE